MDQNTRNDKTLHLTPSDGTLEKKKTQRCDEKNQKMFDYSALLWKTNHTHVKDEGNDSPADEKEAEIITKKRRKPKEKVRCLYTLIYTS